MLQFAVAGPLVRGWAWIVDVIIRFCLLMLIVFLFSDLLSNQEAELFIAGILIIVQFVLAWLYTSLYEGLTGATPGKKMFGLKVIHENATPLTGSGAVIRNFLRAIDGLPVLNAVGLICMLIDNRFRRIGDLAAGTVVVYQDKRPHHSAEKAAQATSPPASLTKEDRQAIVDFAERSIFLSKDRQLELANLLKHHMKDESDPVATLKGWADWIMGGQYNAQSKDI